jgi:hypothetical protein
MILSWRRRSIGHTLKNNRPVAQPFLAVFLFHVAFSLSAQVIIAQSTGFPTDLKQYLNLTAREVAAIHEAATRYNQAAASKQLRLIEIRNEIDAETRKTRPDALTLGVKYNEIESIRRELATQLAALRDQLQASLGRTQRDKLNALDDARNLLPIAYDAQCENLIDLSASGCSLFTFPPELSQYLALSGEQVDTLTNLNSANQKQSAEHQREISQLQSRVAQETTKDILDPSTLGRLDAQIETTRRAIANDLAALRNKTRAVLNDLQRVKLSSLDEARKLQPLIISATCQNLLDPRANPPSCGLTGLFVPSPFPADDPHPQDLRY